MLAQGAEVRLVTDGPDPINDSGYEVVRIEQLYRHARPTPKLLDALGAFGPDQTLVVIGTHELLRPGRFRLPGTVRLLLCSQRFTLREWMRLTPYEVFRERRLLGLVALGSLLPGGLLARRFRASGARDLVYLSADARSRFCRLGLPWGPVIRPQVEGRLPRRKSAGAGPPVVCFFGPPLALRGADLALQAFERACEQGFDARLLMLLRADDPYTMRRAAHLRSRARTSRWSARVEVVDTPLPKERLHRRLEEADLFLLPFKVTVSEVPLVVAEAALMGQPVLVLDTPGITEYAEALGGMAVQSSRELPGALLGLATRRQCQGVDPDDWTDWKKAVTPLLKASRPPDARPLSMLGLVGVDGSGKSTLVDSLSRELRRRAVPHRHVWSRYRNYLSKPFLAVMRLTGHNRKEIVGGVRVGYHDFRASPWLASLFLALQWIDNVIDIMWRYRISGTGRLIVGDRCVLDTLVDLSVATGRADFIFSRYGRSLVALLPAPHQFFMVSRSPEHIRSQRPDVEADRAFSQRIGLYDRMAKALDLTVVSNDGTVQDASGAILRLAGFEDR